MKRALGLYLVLAIGSAAYAAAEPQVFKLFHAKDWAQAHELAQNFSNKHPTDGQASFVLGVSLMYTGQLQQARSLFLALEKKNPPLAALQNNLGVIALVEGDRVQAEKYFRAALTIDSGHTNAQRNLATTQPKTTMAQAHVDKRGLEFLGLFNDVNTVAQASMRSVEKTNTPVVPKQESKAQAAPVQSVKPMDKGVDKAVDKGAGSTSSLKGLVPGSRISMGPEGKNTPTTSGTNPFNEDVKRQVFDALNAWITAWAAQDVKAYLAMYSDDFEPGDGLSKAQWEEQRKQRITAPSQIRIDAVDVVLEVGSPVAVVATFQQHYRAGRLNEISNKMLVFIRDSETANQWKIADERTSY